MPGARCTRSLACESEKHASIVTTGEPNIPAFPARWCYGFLRALPGDRAFLPPSQATMRKHRGQLDISVGISEPHDFAVRDSALSSSARLASIASRPTFRDDSAYAPLCRAGMAAKVKCFGSGRQAGRGAASWHDGQIRYGARNRVKWREQMFRHPPSGARSKKRRVWPGKQWRAGESAQFYGLYSSQFLTSAIHRWAALIAAAYKPSVGCRGATSCRLRRSPGRRAFCPSFLRPSPLMPRVPGFRFAAPDKV
jgi:hypothetical protein